MSGDDQTLPGGGVVSGPASPADIPMHLAPPNRPRYFIRRSTFDLPGQTSIRDRQRENEAGGLALVAANLDPQEAREKVQALLVEDAVYNRLGITHPQKEASHE